MIDFDSILEEICKVEDKNWWEVVDSDDFDEKMAQHDANVQSKKYKKWAWGVCQSL